MVGRYKCEMGVRIRKQEIYMLFVIVTVTSLVNGSAIPPQFPLPPNQKPQFPSGGANTGNGNGNSNFAQEFDKFKKDVSEEAVVQPHGSATNTAGYYAPAPVPAPVAYEAAATNTADESAAVEDAFGGRVQNLQAQGFNIYRNKMSFNFNGPKQLETINTRSFHKESTAFDTHGYNTGGFENDDDTGAQGIEEEHAEVHYHQHRHHHKHNHKQEHLHKHKHDQKHEHGHKHEHKNTHEHKHNQEHKHSHQHKHHHGHKNDHKHDHHHGHHHKHQQDHKHVHKHTNEHKHDHHHGHKHHHDHGHKHDHHHGHKHGHKHEHKHHHKHEHKEEHKHKHDHHHHHKHEHKHHHKHGHKHGHHHSKKHHH